MSDHADPASEGIEDLTGGVTTEFLSSDILDKDLFWKEEMMKVNTDFLFGCATGLFDYWQGEWVDNNRKDIVAAHAYSILEAREIKGERLLKLRNPWGKMEWKGRWSDGSEQWTPEWMELLDHRFGDDGVFWISYKDLLKKYQNFDRTRLFGPEWSVTQQWTSVDVPWAADYNDTKFTVTVTKDTPIVIVLSKLDDRYFQGFEGQYDFSLHFRLDCEDDDDYLVRSHGNYFMGRSVSVDLDIEPGTYSVLMKITAKRFPSRDNPDQVIKASCRNKQEKLIQTGLAYDLAYAKGKYKETEAEKKESEDREARKKAAEHKKKKAKLREDELKRWNIGKRRVQRTKRHAAAKVRHDERRAARLAKERAEKEEKSKMERPEKADDAEDEDGGKAPTNAVNGEGEASKTKPGEPNPTDSKASTDEADQSKTEVDKVEEDKAGKTQPGESKAGDSDESKESSSTDDAPVVVTPPEDTEDKNSPGEPTSEAAQPAEGASVTEAEQSGQPAAVTTQTEAAPEPTPPDGEQNPVEETAEGALKAKTDAPKEEPSQAPEAAGEESDDESVAVQPAPSEPDNPDWAYDSDASFQSSIITELDMSPEEEPVKQPDPTTENKDEDDEFREFSDDPWNAVCVVGLRVYSKDPDLVITVVRPRKLDDEETPLDPDDINKTVADEAGENKSEEQLEEKKKRDEESWKEEKKEGGQEGTDGEKQEDTKKATAGENLGDI